MSTSEPQHAPILTVTWDTVIGSRMTDSGSYDEPPAYEPVNLGELVVAGLVDRLAGDIKRDADSGRYHSAVTEARGAATEAIKAEATSMVRDALTGTFQPMNQWGEKNGQPTTLRDLVMTEVQKFLDEKPPRNGYNDRERPGGLRELLRHEVAELMRKELKAEIDKAKALVRNEVAAKAAELFGDVVKSATR